MYQFSAKLHSVKTEKGAVLLPVVTEKTEKLKSFWGLIFILMNYTGKHNTSFKHMYDFGKYSIRGNCMYILNTFSVEPVQEI
jgi:hypothetical protein